MNGHSLGATPTLKDDLVPELPTLSSRLGGQFSIKVNIAYELIFLLLFLVYKQRTFLFYYFGLNGETKLGGFLPAVSGLFQLNMDLKRRRLVGETNEFVCLFV